MTDDDYTAGEIRRLLANYSLLEEGRLPSDWGGRSDYWGPRLRSGSAKSPFEYAILLKWDIDRAIQNLGNEGKFVVVGINIALRTVEEVGFWMGKSSRDVVNIEWRCIRKMAGMLNKGKQ